MPEAEDLTRHWALHWTCVQTPDYLPWNLPFCNSSDQGNIWNNKMKTPENKQ